MERWIEQILDKYQSDDNFKSKFDMDDDEFLGEVVENNELGVILQKKKECV